MNSKKEQLTHLKRFLKKIFNKKSLDELLSFLLYKSFIIFS